MMYNKVITDVSGIYDNNTGIVIITAPGIYIFHVFAVSSQGEEIYQELYHNNNLVCSLYNYADNEWTDAGNTAILHLQAGDKIGVYAAVDNNIYGSSDEVYTSFSGAMIASEHDINIKGK